MVNKNIIKWIKEHLAIIIALCSFFAYPYVIRWFDPTAAAYDAGVLHIIVITIIMFTVFQWAVWQVINSLWPAIGQYFKNFFNNDFKELDKWQKVKVSLLLYFSLFAALVLLSRVIS